MAPNQKHFKFHTLVIILTLAALLGAAVYATALENQVTNLTIYPDPMRLGSSVSIKFNLGTTGYVSIQVYKDTGEHVRTIWNNIYRQPLSYSLSWDGKDQNGILVPNGSYKIAVEAKDASGTQIGYADKIIKAARMPAVTLVNDTPDPFNPVNGESAAISYTLSTDAMVTVTILKDYTPVRTVVSNTPQTGGVQTIYWDGKDNYGNLVEDRTYIYQIDAVSPFEPTFKSTYKSYTTVEKEEPRITNFTVTPDPLRLAQSYLSAQFTLSEDANATVKILDNSGAVIRTIWDNVSRRAGNSGVSWDGKNNAGSYVPEGTYTVSVSAIDKFGKASAELQTSFVAGYMPTISNAEADPSMFNPVDPAAPGTNISYNISSDALVTVEILNGYDKVRTLTSAEMQSGGVTQSVYWDGRNEAGAVVGDADYTFAITAVSPTVNTFTSTYRGTVTVEQGAPGITGVTLSQEPYRLGTTNLSIQYNLTENANVYINVYKGDVLIKELAKGDARNAGANGTSWNGRDSSDTPVPEGIYTITIKAVDRYGNFDQAQNNVTCGYQPVISSVSSTPEPFDYLTNTDASIYYTLSNDARVTLTILQGSTTVRTIDAGVVPAGSQYITWDASDNSGNRVMDGPYTYEIYAASPTVETFKSTARGTLTVEAQNPQLSGLTVAPTIVKVTGNTSFGYTLSEPATITAKVLKPDGTVVRDLPAQSRAYSGSYNIGWDTRDNLGSYITSGDYLIQITAVDSFSKTGTADLAFKASALPVLSDVFADPASFGAGGNTAINFTVSEPSNITIRMYDSTGTAVKTVCSYLQVPAGSNNVIWDGRNSQGTIVPGIYTFKIDAVSILGSYKGLQASGSVEVTEGTGGGTPQSCTDCHASYPTAHTLTNCDGCHSNEEPVTSIHHDPDLRCADCHGGHGTSQLQSYECTFCHNDTYSYKIPSHPVGTADHTAPIPTDCQNCHNPSLDVEHSKYLNPTSGQPYNCNTCHQSTDPAVANAIANQQKSCDACHTTMHEDTAVVHTNPTFTALPKEPDMDCALCHNSVISDEHTARKDAAGANYTCNTCHSTTAPANVQAAITNNDKNCEACHVDPVNNQPKVHTSAGAPLHNTTYVLSPEINCSQCHINNIKDGHVGKINSTTNQPMDCATCHRSDNPLVVIAITSKDTDCNACHTYPTAKHQPVHTTSVYTTDTTRSDAGTCVTCHTTKNLTDLHVGKVNSATNQAMDCNTCHASTDVQVTTAISTGQTNSCEACHTLHAPKDATAVHNTTDVFAAQMDTDCASCHDRNIKAEHLDKGRTINGVAMTCDSCHASTNSQVVNAINTNNTRCDACHTMPPAKHSPVHTASVYTADDTRTDLTTCSLCHVKVLPDQHVNKVTTAGVTMDCNTCHSSTAADTVKTAVATDNNNCEACHAVHPAKPAITQHDSTDVYAANADVSCASCHERNIRTEHLDNSARTTSTGQAITCDTCHGSADTLVQLSISAGNNKCDACHTYPTAKHQSVHTTNVYTTDVTRTDDCSMCHVSGLTDEHIGKLNTATNQTMDCNTCHASSNSSVVNAINTGQTNSCEACHTLHPVKDVTELHDSVTFTSLTYDSSMNCSSCHNSSLSTEHINKITSSGVTMNCDTCHKSTRPEVQLAIASNNLNCEACHTVHTSPNPYHATTFVANPTMDCAKCHNANSIADDHLQYKTASGSSITCDTCHESTNTAVVNAIETGNTSCDSCHTTRHADIGGPHKNTYIPETTWDCSNCHAASSIGYNMTGSYHIVSGVTSTTSKLHGGTFTTGWSSTSNMTCRDCHNKNLSTNTYYGKLLKGAYTATTGREGYSTANQLCFFCHSTTAYGPSASRYTSSGFKGDGGKNWHGIGNHIEVGGCMSCHSSKLHSSNALSFVAIRSTAEPNSRIGGFTHSSDYSKSNCTTSCH